MAYSNPRYPMKCSYLKRVEVKSGGKKIVWMKCKLPPEGTCIRMKAGLCDIDKRLDAEGKSREGQRMGRLFHSKVKGDTES